MNKLPKTSELNPYAIRHTAQAEFRVSPRISALVKQKTLKSAVAGTLHDIAERKAYYATDVADARNTAAAMVKRFRKTGNLSMNFTNRLIELRARLTVADEASSPSTAKKVAIGAGLIGAGALGYSAYRANQGIKAGLKTVAGRVAGTMGSSIAGAANKVPYKSRLTRAGIRLKKLDAILDQTAFARGDQAGKWIDRNLDASVMPAVVARLKHVAKQRGGPTHSGQGLGGAVSRKDVVGLIKTKRAIDQI